MKKYNITKKFLIEEYIGKKKSLRQIAKETRCSKVPIVSRLKEYSIKIRTIEEANEIRGINELKEKNPNFKHGETLKQHYCKCGRKSSYPTFKYGKGMCIFCSNQGENNSNFNNWSSFEPYTKEFTNNLKEQIRKRDNHTCQKCNITEEEHIIVYGKKLSVHHIDYNKKNCKEENLITMCNECNTRVNFNRKYWKEYFGNKLLVSKENKGE